MSAETLSVTLNGEPHRFPAGSTVADLVASLDIPKERVAVERNREVVRRAEWEAVALEDGDTLEVVHFVGGG